MTNPFLLSAVEDQQATPTNDNPFALPAIQADRRQDLRNTLRAAVQENPDNAAEAERLAKRYPAPNEVLLRNLKDVQLQEAVDKADEKLQTSVKLADYMRTSPFASKQMHDDIEPLSGIEQVFNVARSVPAGLVRVGANTASGAGNLLDIGARATGLSALSRLVRETTGIDPNAALDVAGSLKILGTGGKAIADAIGVDPASRNFATDVGEGIGQLLGQVGIQIVTGGAASFATLTAQGADAMTTKTAGDGASQAMQDTAVLTGAAITALTEKYGVDALLNRVPPKIKNDALRWVADKLAAGGIEASQEIVEGTLQDLVRVALTNPDAEIGDGALYEGSVAGTAAAIVRAALGVRARGAAAAQKGEEATQHAQKLTEAFQAAAASKLRERNPETFRDLAATLTDNATVFVDAQVLAQSANELAQALPAVAEQLQDALDANSTIEIPIADLLTLAPGTPLEQVFLQNARGTPDALSLADTAKAGEQAAEFLRQDAERVMQQAVDQGAWQQESETIKQTVLKQLNTAGRFTADVNESYAALQANFFSTMAARTGMTPQALYDRFMLKVAAGAEGAGVGYKSGRTGRLDGVQAYHYSKADRPVISTSMFGTGLQGSNREQYLNAADQRLRKRAYFYVDKGTGINPEAGVGGRGQRADLDNIYDSNADPLRLKTGRDPLGFESAVLDAGFSGYLDRLSGTQSGMVTLLGDQNIQAETLGALTTTRGRVVPAPAARESKGRDTIVDSLQANAALPSGAPTVARWQELLARQPEVLQALTDAGVFAGDQSAPLYKSDLIKRFIEATETPSYEQSGREEGDTRYQEKAVELLAKTSIPRRSAVAFLSGKQEAPFLATNFDISRYFTERNAMEDYTTPAAQKKIVEALYADTLQALTDSGSAVGWYDRKVTAALDLIAQLHPEIKTDEQAKFGFIAMLAITSNSTRVNENFEKAEALYRAWKETKVWPTEVADAKAADAMRDGLAAVSSLMNQHGWEKVRDFMVADKSIQEIEEFTGVKIASELRDTQVYGAVFLGSKIGAFFNNLYGNFTPVTMDRWFMRTINRVRGNMLSLPGTFGRTLDMFEAQLAADLNTYGVSVDKLRAEIAAYRALPEEARENVQAVLDTLPGVLRYSKARTAEYAAGITDANGKKRSYAIRSAENVLAKNLYESLTLDEQTPNGGGDRKQLREIMVKLQQKLQRNGIPIEMADLQAVLWYYEKDLFARLKREDQGKGLFDGTVEAEDYETAARRVVQRAGGQGAGGTGSGRSAGRSPASASRTTETRADTTGFLFQTAGVNDGRNQQAGDRGGRPAGRNLAPLEGAPSVPGFSGPDPRLVAVAEQYARDNGIPLRRQAEFAQVDPARAKRIADAYEAMQHAPNDPAVREAYENLIRQTMAQYKALEAAGYKFWFMDLSREDNQQYASTPWNAMRDIRANQQMGVFPTNDGFGSGEFDPAANPLLADTGLQWPVGGPDGPLAPVLANDLFRAVHDAFGHGLEGAGFRARGEENAWQAHVRLFTGSAVGAITSETRGQNSWLNYGPHGESNQTAQVEDTVFADQKTGLMPEWTWTEGRVGDMAEEGVYDQDARSVTQTPEFRDWFGNSAVVDANGQPLVVYHGTKGNFSQFSKKRTGVGSTMFGDYEVERHGIFVTPSAELANDFATQGERNKQTGANVMPLYASIKNPLDMTRGYTDAIFNAIEKWGNDKDLNGYRIARNLGDNWGDWMLFDEDNGQDPEFLINMLKDLGYDGVKFYEPKVAGEGASGDTFIAFDPEQIKSATGNQGTFDPTDPDILKQGPRGTFNPQSMEIMLNENADLSTFLHESGHFFLEVLADLASKPDAPQQIRDDMDQFLKWAGITGNDGSFDANDPSILSQNGPAASAAPAFTPKRTPLETWTAMTLDQKRPYHERWAESFEQYLFEGKAPSQELQPLFRRFRSFLTNVYKSLKAFVASRRAAPRGGVDELAQSAGGYTAVSEAAPGGHSYSVEIQREGVRVGEAVFYRDKYNGRSAVHLEFISLDKSERGGNGAAVTKAVMAEAARRFPYADYVTANPAGKNSFAMIRRVLGKPLTMAIDSTGQKLKSEKALKAFLPDKGTEGPDGEITNATAYVAFRMPAAEVFKQGTASSSDIQLSDEIRQVFDRLLATDEQIAQSEQTAGLLPDFDATNEALEKLTARSLRDLKWAVNARNKTIKALQKQAAGLRKGVEAEVRAEVEAQPMYAARKALRAGTKLGIDGLEALYMGEGDRYALLDWKPLVDQKLAGKEGMHPDIAADMFGFKTGDELVRALLTAEPINSVIEGMTDQRMLERHGDLVDQRAIEEAANEAVHNEARAKSLATELKAQSDMLNPRQDTGRTNTQGQPITVNAIAAAAKEFAANLAARRRIKDLKNAAHQHRAAEARAGKAWQAATTKGDTQGAVQAKRDQVLNNAAVKALQEAQIEAKKIAEFFSRVAKDSDEKTVTKGRDPDVVNAARAILAAYGVRPAMQKSAVEYLAVLKTNDPAMYDALEPSIAGATNNAKPLSEMTMEELRGLKAEIDAMWHLAKRSRQMEVDGTLLDIQDAADELQARMQAIGVPDAAPGEARAITNAEKRARWLQHAGSLLRRTEQWAEGMGGGFTRLVFQPVKEAANRYRADRVKYRKAYQALVDQVAPALRKGSIAAPEIGYTFGEGHNGIGHAELLHAVLHTGNESNKRKLLLGRKWATENEDGTLDTTRWDAFMQRMYDTGVLGAAHYDFAQGVWDLLEQTKPLAQKTHRDVFGRYFAEVTADEVVTPFGAYRGGYVPAQADPRIVQDADLRKLAEAENESMAYSFPATNKGFTKGRVEYNRPLMLDLRSIGQHLDKVLLFSHMEPAVRDVNKLLSQKGVSYSLGRIDPTIYAGMLTPWLSRSARQIVETPILGDGGISRVLSAARSRAGMALMFANVSNTLQQLSGFSTAFAKLKADGLNSHMMRAAAQFVQAPKAMVRNVAAASPFMEGRMENEIAAINDAMDAILLDPSLYEKSQAWVQKHAYFMQTAMANTMEPIIWTAGYNGALEKGMTERDAVRYADALVRQTQGSTLPEDVSRIETGPAYARVFTQFIGYFNMMANTNATALKQIAGDVGLRKGAGKALLVVTTGMLIPLWVAEAIAIAMRGGPEDEDDDGYLDDWLASVLGMGTIKGAFAMAPFVGSAVNVALNKMNDNPADDKASLSPAVSLLEAGAGVPKLVYQGVTDPESINARNAVRDVSSAISLATGLPAYALSRPLGYLAGVEQGKTDPTGPADMVRGLVTGTASPESK